MTRTDTIIAILCYITVASIVLYYNMTHPLVNDGVQEYQEYLLNIQNGWQYRISLTNSCLVTTWIPALLSRGLGLDEYILFRVFPVFFYPLMATFVYLIARRYLEVKYAVVAVAVVIVNSHILYFPDIGRVGVAIAFMAGMLWALLERRLIWTIVFGALVVFSHYGTALIATGIVGFAFFGLLLWKRIFEKYCFVVFSLLVLLVVVWLFIVAGFSGEIMSKTLFQTKGGVWEDTGQVENPDFLDATIREPAVQDALGIDLASMPTPKKLEIVANWIVVLLVSLGLLLFVRNKAVDSPAKLVAIGLYGLILFTIALPWLSVFYGGMRVYFTSLSILATCFPLGACWLAKKVRVSPFALIIPVLLFYALGTSGLIYLPFGLVKYFTVVYSLG